MDSIRDKDTCHKKANNKDTIAHKNLNNHKSYYLNNDSWSNFYFSKSALKYLKFLNHADADLIDF